MSDPDPLHAQLAPTRSRAPLALALSGLGLLALALLAFGVFGVQALFIDDQVSEDGPTFASGASTPGPSDPGSRSTDEVPEGGSGASRSSEVPTIRTVATGTFADEAHSGAGTVTVLTDGSQTFVRYEADFSTENGPDLYAVVVVDGEIVELDRLKGNQGSQNYELPAGLDPTDIESVAVWCKRFDVIFTRAALG